jgi:hypothetical protein
MASTIIPCSELNIKDLKFYAPKATQGGGKNVGIMHTKTHTGLRMSLPIMFTFGASDYQGNQQFSFSLQFPDTKDESVSTEYGECLHRLVEFEANLKQKVLEYSKDWLGKQLKSIEMVDMIWTPMLKYPKNTETKEPDHTRAPTLSVKLPCWEGKWSSEVYDENRVKLFPNPLEAEATPVQFITRGNHMATIVQCGGLWIVGGKMGVTWKLVQTVVKQQNTSISGVCHINIKETDKTKLSSVADLTKHIEPEHESETIHSSSHPISSSHVEDSDQEDEEEEEHTTNKKLEEEVDEEEEEEEEPSAPKPIAPTPSSSDKKPRGRTAKK